MVYLNYVDYACFKVQVSTIHYCLFAFIFLLPREQSFC